MNTKLAWRNLKKNKLYAFINILGLTIGIASCLLIGIYIKHELSYDNFQANGDRIVRATMEYEHSGGAQQIAVTGTKAGPQFKRMMPRVEAYVRTLKSSAIVSYADKVFEEKSLLYADANFFKVFSFKLTDGDITSVLNAPDKIVITQKAAQKYFGGQQAIGKVLKVGSKTFTVSAVAQDVPSNSQIQYDFVLPFSLYLDRNGPEQWWSANNMTYLLLNSKDDVIPLQKEIKNYMADVSKNELKMTGHEYLTFNIQPLKDVHLHGNMPDEFEPGGSITYIYIMLAVAVLILLIACVNYVNLAIAQSAGRGGEIGVRKVMGAGKGELFWQFITESIFTAVIAAVLAVALAAFVLPLFNNISGKQLQLSAFGNPVILVGLAVLSLFIGFAAGAYPAILLSGANLAKILKSGFSFTSGQNVRKSLIVFQFVISIFLIISTVIILQQLSYIRNKDVGYNKSNVVVLPIDSKILPQLDALEKGLSLVPGVRQVAAANNEPINVGWGDVIKTNDGKKISVNAIPVDENFVKTIQLKMIAGSDYTHADLMTLDTSNNYKNYRYSFILNESAVKALGWTPEQAIGKTIDKNTPGVIKGVVKDFNFKTFHDPITPLVLFLNDDQLYNVFVRIDGNNTSQTIAELGKVWKSRISHRPFDYRFLDDDYDALYRTEQRTAGVFTTFSVLAILLACLGLFAITAFAVVQRTKEIGIRKVLGASIANIIMLIAKDFLALVVVATIIASPIAWYISSKWLQDFAYRIDIQWWVFVITGIAALLVAAVTVSIQSTKAALANPVKSLKSE
ncbi:ABC transporter permease [Mucilaginibacter ginsenosidivorax]|uniref:FtsX-like permease family protein n=1 Tax=Mucilaginibacter ginsenosidivorax TaxID=862126 RepID=A0A5B8WA34_9SPHI|nr:ABC transporter permease [Mucilaginibacter ginsenosidivorax]QEC79836.1 FtsX-like permease family protein [Mucilaginibacter ginsenosidivorax]